MGSYQIMSLSMQFYKDYPSKLYPEILSKNTRHYYVAVIKLNYLKGKYICIPFRSEMNHNNGYKFRFSKRSKIHKSGLDFSKLVIITNLKYLEKDTCIDADEFLEMLKNDDIITRKLIRYIDEYKAILTGNLKVDQQYFNRRYKYSTLKYFHKELGIDTY